MNSSYESKIKKHELIIRSTQKQEQIHGNEMDPSTQQTTWFDLRLQAKDITNQVHEMERKQRRKRRNSPEKERRRSPATPSRLLPESPPCLLPESPPRLLPKSPASPLSLSHTGRRKREKGSHYSLSLSLSLSATRQARISKFNSTSGSHIKKAQTQRPKTHI